MEIESLKRQLKYLEDNTVEVNKLVPDRHIQVFLQIVIIANLKSANADLIANLLSSSDRKYYLLQTCLHFNSACFCRPDILLIQRPTLFTYFLTLYLTVNH
jgi:hypothetical protein